MTALQEAELRQHAAGGWRRAADLRAARALAKAGLLREDDRDGYFALTEAGKDALAVLRKEERSFALLEIADRTKVLRGLLSRPSLEISDEETLSRAGEVADALAEVRRMKRDFDRRFGP